MDSTAPLAPPPPRRSAPASPRVDVIGIGVQKAASSWIFRCMVEHPQVRSSARAGSVKELNFFNHDYEKGYLRYHEGFEFGAWRTMEFSVLYFHDRDVPDRVRRYNPDARLVLALRNPIDRAYSQHKHEVRRARVPREMFDFWTALEQNPSYVEQGLYATHLERWLEHFDLEQIHVVEFEDVAARPLEVLRGLFEFAGVDPAFRSTRYQERFSSRYAPRYPALMRVMRSASTGVRRSMGGGVHALLKATGVPGLVRARNRMEVDERVVPPLTAEDRARLGERFAAENARLGDLLGRDYSHWR